MVTTATTIFTNTSVSTLCPVNQGCGPDIAVRDPPWCICVYLRTHTGSRRHDAGVRHPHCRYFALLRLSVHSCFIRSVACHKGYMQDDGDYAVLSMDQESSDVKKSYTKRTSLHCSRYAYYLLWRGVIPERLSRPCELAEAVIKSYPVHS